MPLFSKKIKDFFQKGFFRLIAKRGIIFIGLVIISFYSVFLLSSLTDIKEGVISLHLKIAENAKIQVEGFLNENVKALNDLAQILVVSKTQEIKIIDRILKERESLVQIALINDKGQEILKRSRSLTFSPGDLKDLSWAESFIRPMEGEIYLSSVYTSEESVPFVTVGLPMRPAPDQIAGVLLAELSLIEIRDIVAEIKAGVSGQTYLVDSRGYLIAHPDIGLVLKETNLFTRKAVEKVIIEKKIVKGVEKEEYFNEKGKKVYVVGLPLKEIGWGIFVEEPDKDSWAAYRKIRNLGLGSILVTIILFLVLFFNIRTLTKTLHELEASKMALEESKIALETRVEARTKELKELTESLDEQVKERTKELQEKIDELERFQRLTVGRELKMIELKEEIEKLKGRANKLIK